MAGNDPGVAKQGLVVACPLEGLVGRHFRFRKKLDKVVVIFGPLCLRVRHFISNTNKRLAFNLVIAKDILRHSALIIADFLVHTIFLKELLLFS